MKTKQRKKAALPGRLRAAVARLSFWQKIYLCTLALFLVCLNAGVFAVATLGQQRSFEAERDRLLTRQHFIAQTLAQDMAAVEARRPGAMSALTENYLKSYVDETTGLRIQRAETVTDDQLPQPDEGTLPRAETEGVRSWSILPVDGERWLFVSALLPGQTMRTELICAFAMEDFFTGWETTAHSFQLIALVVSALLAVGLWFTLRGLGRPLTRLADAARAIGAGDYSARAALTGADEIGQLAAAFNEMARRTGETVAGLAEAAEEKQRLADSMAHELRTPLTAIGGYAEYIARAELTGEERAEAAGIIQQETRRLSAMSERLLAMASLREGKLDAAPLDLARAVRAALHTMRPKAVQKQVRLVAAPLDSCPMWGDEDLLVSLAVNLLDNAVKASPEGGRVTLSLRAAPRGPLLEITDEGPGMDRETLDRLGEPFFRADRARSRAQGGTGLGVAFCFAIAAAHGAQLTYASQRGCGTTARVRFLAEKKDLHPGNKSAPFPQHDRAILDTPEQAGSV